MNYPVLMFKTENSYHLWKYGENNNREECEEAFENFQLSHIISGIKSNCAKYPDFYVKSYCREQETAEYRVEIFKELCENADLYEKTLKLCSNLETLKATYLTYWETKNQVQKYYQYIYFLASYFQRIDDIKNIYEDSETEGLVNLRSIIKEHSESEKFTEVRKKAEQLFEEVKNIFSMNIEFYTSDGLNIRYEQYGGGFTEQFKEAAKKLLDADITAEFSVISGNPISPLEEFIAEDVKYKFTDVFAELDELHNNGFETLNYIFFELPQQIYFYTGYIHFMKEMGKKEFYFSFPKFNAERKLKYKSAYDLSLAARLANENKKVIANDVILENSAGFILTGANQGGKTTYLRSLGITACLANNGMPVPCSEYHACYFDHIFTHFNKAEIVGYKKGRLGEEIERFENIMDKVTDKSLLLVNEAFASTRRLDGVEISLHFLRKLIKANSTFGIVTHFYEIYDLINSEYEGKVQSLVVMVNDENSAQRLYKVMNLPPNTIAYAHDIAKMCGVTYEQLLEEL